jgi:hypothetical protein
MKTIQFAAVAVVGLVLGGIFATPSVATEPTTIAGPTASTYKLSITGMT